MTDKFYGNTFIGGQFSYNAQEKYLKHNTLIYNLYRQLQVMLPPDYKHPLLEQAHKYLEERNLLDKNEED